MPPRRTDRLLRLARTVHRAGRGLGADLTLYAVSAAYAAFTALYSTLPAHRTWGTIALPAYLVLALVALVQLLLRRGSGTRVRMGVVFVGWAGTTLLPLIVEAAARAGGALGKAQDEVEVVEMAGARLVDTGTPYLSHEGIAAALPSLGYLAYVPYNPGIAVFGLPRRYFGDAWWTDARVGFAVVTGAALIAALCLLRQLTGGPVLVRAAQVVTVLPVCALTLATGGDDMPVLALSLLALAFAARALATDGRPALYWWLAAGLVAGDTAAMKMFALPVLVIIGVLLFVHVRGAFGWYVVPAIAVPAATLLPVILRNPDAVVENLIRYPMGNGLAESPAASNFPGHLLAVLVPQGSTLAAGLLAATALLFVVHLVARPPATAGSASWRAGVALLLAILIAPASRFGYLLYPAAYAVWAVALTTRLGRFGDSGADTAQLPVATRTQPA